MLCCMFPKHTSFPFVSVALFLSVESPQLNLIGDSIVSAVVKLVSTNQIRCDGTNCRSMFNMLKVSFIASLLFKLF